MSWAFGVYVVVSLYMYVHLFLRWRRETRALRAHLEAAARDYTELMEETARLRAVVLRAVVRP